jgi:uncharacterized OB-fold protein
MMYRCNKCGHIFFWSPPNHWGPICPICGDQHSYKLPEK